MSLPTCWPPTTAKYSRASCTPICRIGRSGRKCCAPWAGKMTWVFNLIDQRVVLPCELVVRESCGAHAHPNWRPAHTPMLELARECRGLEDGGWGLDEQ